MLDQEVLARLHVSAVLQNIEELVDFDAAAKDIVKDWRATIQFSCPGGIGAHLEFGGGRARWADGTTSMPSVALWFATPGQLNNMFTGKGVAIPVPWMGVWNVGLLKGFTELTKRLEHYLKPAESTLADRAAFEFHTKCLLYTAMYGLAPIAAYDHHVRHFVSGIRDGVVEFRIANGPAAHVTVKDGKLFPAKGRSAEPSVSIELPDYETAYGMLSGKLDVMALVGARRAEIRGFIPLVDKIGSALDRLAVYLN